MKKIFEEPSIECVSFATEEITSGNIEEPDIGGGVGSNPHDWE